MSEPKKRKFKPTVETKLAQADSNRVGELARAEGKTKSEVVREAVLWYLDHKEELANRDREAQIAKEIRAMTDRVCGMLARQGAALGTLYELTWMSLPNEDARNQFSAAVTTAKQKMRNRLEKDERDLAEQLKRVVSP
jgi:predicted DNA-binding protein